MHTAPALLIDGAPPRQLHVRPGCAKSCPSDTPGCAQTPFSLRPHPPLPYSQTALSYASPLHIVRGQGSYLFDAQGQRYLDCINNVAHVGHCHPQASEEFYPLKGRATVAALDFHTFAAHTLRPRYGQVTQAVCQQLATLNTNSRYLHADLTTYTSELLATLPPSLQVCGGA